MALITFGPAKVRHPANVQMLPSVSKNFIQAIVLLVASILFFSVVPQSQAQQKTCLLYTSPSPRDRG